MPLTHCIGVYYSATAHTGGTVKDEKNHITAEFFKGDKKGSSNKGLISSSWTVKATGEVKMGEKHHVYVSDKQKVPSAWSKAVGASHDRKMVAKNKEEAELKKVRDAKVEAAKKAGAYKTAQRKAAKAEKASI